MDIKLFCQFFEADMIFFQSLCLIVAVKEFFKGTPFRDSDLMGLIKFVQNQMTALSLRYRILIECTPMSIRAFSNALLMRSIEVSLEIRFRL